MTTTTRDREDRYGPMEWAQNSKFVQQKDDAVDMQTLSPHILPILIFFLQRCCWVSMLLNDDLLSHLPLLVSLHYLGKHEPQKFGLFSYAVYQK